MLQHPPCARYTGFYHGVGAPTGPPLGAPILRIAPSRCPKPSLALTPAAVGLMYGYTNNRGRAVGADLAGAIRVLSGRGYADFHAGANFAITEFYEVSSAWGCTPHTARYLADRVLLATEGV